MKIGLISDVHGDIAHLNAALQLLNTHQVDQILCTGDLTHGEPYEDQVIDTIRAHNIICTMGNHDEQTAQEERTSQSEHSAPQSKLKRENLTYLESLPMTHVLQAHNKTILLTHATPWNHNIHIFSFSSTSLLQQVVSEAASDVIIVGHTHEPMQRYFAGTLIVNPGSLHQNRFVDQRTFAILSLPELAYTVYDLSTGTPINQVIVR